MRSKQVPEIIKFMKKSKKRNLMKTTIFTMFLRGWDITNQLIFQSKIIKNHACNPNMLFDTPNHRTYQKVTQNGLQWGTQNPPKIIKNHLYSMGTESATCAIRRSNNAFLRTPEHVKVCQMIPNGFSLSLGWADHFPEAAKTVNEYS